MKKKKKKRMNVYYESESLLRVKFHPQMVIQVWKEVSIIACLDATYNF